MASPIVIELRDVSKNFEAIHALHGFDLTVEAGVTTVLIGPSGCGKSTVLRLITGLISPNRGHVYFQGTEVTPDTVLRLRRRMGYVIQEGGLFPHLTAEGNVTLLARYLEWHRERIEQRLHDLAVLTLFPLESLGRFPAQLSGGQRQRVSLMRALMLDPDVLLLDEPLGALDPLIRAELQTDLKKIFRTLKKSVILVTHDMGEAAFFGDLVVLMRDGEVVQRGGIRDLVQSPASPFVTKFINAQRQLGGARGSAGEK